MSMLLGRPFLKIAKAVIDVDKGSLTLQHKEKYEKFYASDYPSTSNPMCLSYVIFQDSGQPSKFEVLDEDVTISLEYG